MKQLTHFNSFYVAGFQYYAGSFLFEQMRVGGKVTFVRDSMNRYDGDAIEIRFDGEKIGFVPRSENNVMAKVMDAGYEIFKGVIQQLSPDEHPSAQVRVGAFIKHMKKRK